MRENTEKWMELCAQAATEQDSRKLMALIDQITALLDAKQIPTPQTIRGCACDRLRTVEALVRIWNLC